MVLMSFSATERHVPSSIAHPLFKAGLAVSQGLGQDHLEAHTSWVIDTWPSAVLCPERNKPSTSSTGEGSRRRGQFQKFEVLESPPLSLMFHCYHSGFFNSFPTKSFTFPFCAGLCKSHHLFHQEPFPEGSYLLEASVDRAIKGTIATNASINWF